MNLTLNASQIAFRIGKKQILENVNIQLVPGRFTAVLGPNGAGKSTLLKVLAGDIKPLAGEVILNDKALDKYHKKGLSRARAVLPQAPEVYFPFRVSDLVELGCFPLGLSSAESKKRVNMALERTGMQPFRDRVYSTLSGGEKQRVQLARVILQISHDLVPAKYLLLDEPTNGLDLAYQHLILQESKALCSENVGVMAVLHDLNLAGQYADDILLMKGGREVAYGPAKEVLTKKNIEETYQHPVELLHLNKSGVPYVVPATVDTEEILAYH